MSTWKISRAAKQEQKVQTESELTGHQTINNQHLAVTKQTIENNPIKTPHAKQSTK